MVGLPSGVGILVSASGLVLMDALSADPYSQESVTASQKLCTLCKVGLILTVCSNTAFQLVQLIWMKRLHNLDSVVELPLLSILFLLGAMLFSQMVTANKSLKEDNDSII